MITAVLAVLDRRRREKVAGLLREMGVSPGAEATDGAQALEACRKTRLENVLFHGYCYEKTHIDKY